MLLRYIKKIIQINIFPKKIKLSNKPKVFIFLAADYGNIGDIAITIAQEKFLMKYFNNYEIIKIPIKKTYNYYKYIRRNIKSNDIITIIGGGNLGDIYYGFELKRQFIIKKFKNNKIISFPQSIYFTETKFGNKIKRMTQKIYNDHPNLVLFSRESKTFDIMKQLFKNNKIYLVPDIVLSYDCDFNYNRENILLCFRNDCEQKINNDVKFKLVDSIIKKYKNQVIKTDTHINIKNNIDNLDDLFEKKLTEFSKAKLVITDRLHGMIFCVITRTPCIVLPNSNHKILKTYENWLNDIEWIKYFEELSIQEIMKQIEQYIKLEKIIGKPNFIQRFDSLIKECDCYERNC